MDIPVQKRLKIVACLLVVIILAACTAQTPEKPGSDSTSDNFYTSIKKHSDTRQDIIEQLPEINWRDYDLKQTEEILDWIGKQDFQDKGELLALFRCAGGLDGAPAERYASIINSEFEDNVTVFVEALAELTDPGVRRIAVCLKYGFNNPEYKKESIEQLNEISRYEHTTGKEREVIQVILDHANS